MATYLAFAVPSRLSAFTVSFASELASPSDQRRLPGQHLAAGIW